MSPGGIPLGEIVHYHSIFRLAEHGPEDLPEFARILRAGDEAFLAHVAALSRKPQ